MNFGLGIGMGFGGRMTELARIFASQSFWAPLTSNNSVPVGAGPITATRASTATTAPDFEGLTRTAKVNEMRFQGARRVENLLAAPNDLTNASWVSAGVGTVVVTGNQSDPEGGTTATRLQLTSGAGYAMRYAAIPAMAAGTARQTFTLWSNNGASQTIGYWSGTAVTLITITPIPKRYVLSATQGGNFGLIAWAAQGTDAVLDFNIWHPMCEDVTGQSNQNPSEYVPSAGDVVGAELITNGTNPTATTGWSGGGISVISGEFNATSAWASQAKTTVIGKTYQYSTTHRYAGGTSGLFRIGSTLGGSDNAQVTIGATSNVTTSGFFVATATTTYLAFAPVGGGSVSFNNISVKEVSSSSGAFGVKYFDTTNGNTVAGNVVTEATGYPLGSSNMLGAELANIALVARGTVVGNIWTTTSVTTVQYGVVGALPAVSLTVGRTYRLDVVAGTASVVDATHNLVISESYSQNSGLTIPLKTVSKTPATSSQLFVATQPCLTIRSQAGTATVGDYWDVSISVHEVFPAYSVVSDELVTNGDFSSATGWTLGGAAAITGGQLVFNSASDTFAYQDIIQSGKTYKVSFDYNITSGAVNLYAGTNGGAGDAVVIMSALSGSGSYSGFIVATGTRFIIRDTSGCVATFDNISVRQVSTVAKSGALTEPAATNKVLHSGDMTNAVWAKRGATNPITGATDPFGGSTATTVTVGGSAVDDVFQSVSGYIASTPISNGVWIKRISTSGQLNIQKTSDPANGKWLVDMSLLPDAFVYLTEDNVAVTVSSAWSASPAGVGGQHFFATTGTISFVHGGSNQEAGATATSYIPTTTAAVTRASDYKTVPAIGNVTNAAGTIYIEHTPSGLTDMERPISIGAGSDYIDLRFNHPSSLGKFAIVKAIAGVYVTVDTLTNTFPVGVSAKVAMSYGALGFLLSVNGVGYSSPSTTTPAAAALSIAMGNIGVNIDKNLRTWPTQKTQAELNLLTAP